MTSLYTSNARAQLRSYQLWWTHAVVLSAEQRQWMVSQTQTQGSDSCPKHYRHRAVRVQSPVKSRASSRADKAADDASSEDLEVQGSADNRCLHPACLRCISMVQLQCVLQVCVCSMCSRCSSTSAGCPETSAVSIHPCLYCLRHRWHIHLALSISAVQ